MTTMFVQLRRVVYLLVLLQFCVYVAHAEDSSTEDETYSQAKELDRTETRLNVLVPDVVKQLLKGNTSLSMLKTEVELCEEYSEIAKLIAEKANKPVAEEETTEGPKIKCVKSWEQIEELLNETNDIIAKTKSSAALCKIVYGNLDNVVTPLNPVLEYYPTLLNETANLTPEKEKTIQNYTNIDKAANILRQILQLTLQKSVVFMREAEMRVQDVEKQKDTIKTNMNGKTICFLAKKPEEQKEQKEQEEQEDPKLQYSKLLQLLQQIFPEPEPEKQEITSQQQIEEMQMTTGGTENKEPHENTLRENTVAPATTINENAAGGQQTQQNAANPNLGTQQGTGTTEGATSEKDTNENPQKQNEASNATPSDLASSSSKPSNVTRKNDSSGSPALVHGPLLLLLLCVLGCTAVF